MSSLLPTLITPLKDYSFHKKRTLKYYQLTDHPKTIEKAFSYISFFCEFDGKYYFIPGELGTWQILILEMDKDFEHIKEFHFQVFDEIDDPNIQLYLNAFIRKNILYIFPRKNQSGEFDICFTFDFSNKQFKKLEDYRSYERISEIDGKVVCKFPGSCKSLLAMDEKNDFLYVLDGHDENLLVTPGLWCFDFNNRIWYEMEMKNYPVSEQCIARACKSKMGIGKEDQSFVASRFGGGHLECWNDSLVLYGGAVLFNGKNFNEEPVKDLQVLKFDFNSRTWSAIESKGKVPDLYFSEQVIGGFIESDRLFIISLNRMCCFDLVNGHWTIILPYLDLYNISHWLFLPQFYGSYFMKDKELKYIAKEGTEEDVENFTIFKMKIQ